ncbi:kinesin-like protein [Lineolata rhizophorae]|uniref:Kinesin-like protein n=1 Tax=Lineolata rhizophorae TaxID=578093 RepID=A0A6A6NZ98_9PEZI|nr:kinesin-like protein [Lineolata rhizophorae]
MSGPSTTRNHASSFSSSTASSYGSRNASRNADTTSLGTSVGSRPNGYRPHTAMSLSRSTSATGNGGGRPAQPGSEGSSIGTIAETTSNNPRGGEPKAPTFDPSSGLEYFHDMMKETMEGLKSQRVGLADVAEMYKARISELEAIKSQLESNNIKLTSEINETRSSLFANTAALDEEKRARTRDLEDAHRRHRNDLEDVEEKHRRESERTRRDAEEELSRTRRTAQEETDRLLRVHREELAEVERRLRGEADEERNRLLQEMKELSGQLAEARQKCEADVGAVSREVESVKGQLSAREADLERERAQSASLRDKLAESAANLASLDGTNKAMKANIDFLESDNQQQSQAFAELHARMQAAIEEAERSREKLRQEETLRRKLHNQVQELKGNIRVFCRVRPLLPSEAEAAADDGSVAPAKIAFPDQDVDGKEITVQGPEQKSSLGTVTTATHPFAFDRVFGPAAQNADVFDEISQLVQSALDGYNVCIFCYGQTGSGKTHTMSAPADGMIPRAVAQIWQQAKGLEEKGWRYTMTGAFVEVYNESLNDLLGRAEDLDRKKLEIRHDAQRCKTSVPGATTVALDGPDAVHALLARAAKNRSVAATKANERSSRSHSVFMLSLQGANALTGERSEGVLNLVDLAGSERLAHSGATGDRLKETQNINRSLSCLGDVIAALGAASSSSSGAKKADGGAGGGHVPYRNSKLTYLLQYSLGGNSKTLMFVMVSPLLAHLGETLTSLKFATKVHNTHIGTARRQAKVKD